MSKHAAGASQDVHRTTLSAYDDPGTPEEISRRNFMATATLSLSGIIGLGLVIPIVGSLVPRGGSGTGDWAPLSAEELKSLEAATNKPVKLTFTLKAKDSYLPMQSSDEYVWGIKVADQAAFEKARPDVYVNGKADVPYDAVTMNMVIFSPICPHLGCRFAWDDAGNKFACPCHGSQFTLDGEHIAGPAPRGLDPLPLREQKGVAEIMWIRYAQSQPSRIVVTYQS
ncbi:MAG: ubiquinol-cytochrome c reductase iron-sulfur subunit [Candidatus Eremiobacteraeota bacterium]|nr:ubiquinol-cytochrome c reductase iron-sulfur subunit [Candidatus Eremiobacteraeota bacterium]